MTLADENLPNLYRAADMASGQGQRRFMRLASGVLATSLSAAVFGALTLERGGTDWAGVVATVIFVAGILLTVWLLMEHPERKWYDGRAAAESVKTLAWQYAVGGGAFALGPSKVSDPDDLFLTRLSQIDDGLKHITVVGTGAAEITPAMRSLRAASLDDRRRAYGSGRIENQRGWYARKASWNEHRSELWRGAMIALQALGALGGVLKATGHLSFDLIGLAAAATASVGAWLQMKQHVTLAEAYAVAERDLNLNKARLDQARSEDDWAKFVEDAEAAMSREHTVWVARRGLPLNVGG